MSAKRDWKGGATGGSGGNASEDRRVRRTQQRLHDALGDLIREKPYDAIAVKEILHRADVGRSTFYAHFSDKDELLLSGMREMLRTGRPAKLDDAPARYERLVWFGGPLFAHIASHRPQDDGPVDARAWAVVHGFLEQALTELVTDELRRASGVRPMRPEEAQLLVAYVVSTFTLVLGWWIDRAGSVGPAEADAHFRSLVVPTLSAALD